MSAQPHAQPDGGPTSVHIARAHDGDEASRAWIVARFSPFLLMQARYRLHGGLRRICTPEDIVDEVWLVTLPRLGDLRPRDGTWKPVLLKFLGTTLLNQVNTLLTRHLRERSRTAQPSEPVQRFLRSKGIIGKG